MSTMGADASNRYKVKWTTRPILDPKSGLSVEIEQDFMGAITRKLISVQREAEDEAVKEALRQLGWIAPEDVVRLRNEEYTRGYVDGSIGRVGY